LGPRGGGVRSHEKDAPLRETRVARPDLLTVDDELVAVDLGTRAERGEVGPRVRLAESLAPELVAGEHFRQEALLLLVGPMVDQRRSDQRDADAEAHQARRATPGV